MPTPRAKRAFAKCEALEAKRVAIYQHQRSIEQRAGIGSEAKEIIFGRYKNSKSESESHRHDLLLPDSEEWYAAAKRDAHERRRAWRELYFSVPCEKTRKELIEQECEHEEACIEVLRATVDAYEIEREEIRRPSAARSFNMASLGVAVVASGQVAFGITGAIIAACVAFVTYRYHADMDKFERDRLLDKNAIALKSAQQHYERVRSYGLTFSLSERMSASPSE